MFKRIAVNRLLTWDSLFKSNLVFPDSFRLGPNRGMFFKIQSKSQLTFTLSRIFSNHHIKDSVAVLKGILNNEGLVNKVVFQKLDPIFSVDLEILFEVAKSIVVEDDSSGTCCDGWLPQCFTRPVKNVFDQIFDTAFEAVKLNKNPELFHALYNYSGESQKQQLSEFVDSLPIETMEDCKVLAKICNLDLSICLLSDQRLLEFKNSVNRNLNVPLMSSDIFEVLAVIICNRGESSSLERSRYCQKFVNQMNADLKIEFINYLNDQPIEKALILNFDSLKTCELPDNAIQLMCLNGDSFFVFKSFTQGRIVMTHDELLVVKEICFNDINIDLGFKSIDDGRRWCVLLKLSPNSMRDSDEL